MITIVRWRHVILLGAFAICAAGILARRMDLSWLDVAVGKEMGYTPGRLTDE